MASSGISAIGGVQSYEEATTKALYSDGSEGKLGKDTFLKLLTVQLQHQDPLNPMDNTQFVAQLSQFSSLEQLTDVNSNLNTLGLGMSSVGSATMVNMIGKEVRATGDGFSFDGEKETLHYKLDAPAEKVTLTIFDEDGNAVQQVALSNQAAGDQSFDWKGETLKGLKAGAGNYTFQISAINGSENVASTTYIQGMVDQIDFSSGIAMPRVDGQTVTVDRIVQIIEPDPEE